MEAARTQVLGGLGEAFLTLVGALRSTRMISHVLQPGGARDRCRRPIHCPNRPTQIRVSADVFSAGMAADQPSPTLDQDRSQPATATHAVAYYGLSSQRTGSRQRENPAGRHFVL